ncbi:hypothetical protein VB834_15220 [Limnoraphis robusta Tam1]|uniref:Uncharacterized protein n=1 Tax=Limnoraphis robusta CCNP1315 TaxID=3110306 RepID=A0ABU5U349_9CYAN|nr:hypothetical protein [Limnoraphis robusta]MEA5498351.1 hypothetical protein [Limnoraphis robusta BA-68 BA1]MEA5521618.1 hypothetical protein [Limnoraphis robusta CCNP1315]MEA5540375.1 hypothetical protein [Limnoraphis robusta Tam1]MEA5545198.1 hypothetical protein [Limnoraphis robusta CCNP1324]
MIYRGKHTNVSGYNPEDGAEFFFRMAGHYDDFEILETTRQLEGERAEIHDVKYAEGIYFSFPWQNKSVQLPE